MYVAQHLTHFRQKERIQETSHFSTQYTSLTVSAIFSTHSTELYTYPYKVLLSLKFITATNLNMNSNSNVNLTLIWLSIIKGPKMGGGIRADNIFAQQLGPN